MFLKLHLNMGLVIVLVTSLLSARADEKKEPPIQEKKVTVNGIDHVLKYQDLKVGDGEEIRPGDYVRVHYTGWLTDGKKFDSSHDRGQPFTVLIGTGKVIKGWDEGVPGMRVGGKRKLIIPSALAYGTRGVPGTIPPNADLVFEIEVIKRGR
jgi:FKBP-type peptidyl-prolyl cis-trans isomerase FkpA